MKYKKPTVETYFGINYKYRDPVGVGVEFIKLRHCLVFATPKMVTFLRWIFSNVQTSTEYTVELSLCSNWYARLISYFSSLVVSTNLFLGISLPAVSVQYNTLVTINLTNYSSVTTGKITPGRKSW